MAELTSSPEVLEIAQAQKEPKFPKRPEPTKPQREQSISLQLRKWAEDMLASEAKIEVVKKALSNMLVFGGGKDKIATSINALRPALEAGRNLRQHADSRMDLEAISLYNIALGDLFETLPKAPSKMGLIFNPFTMNGDGAQVLGEMNGAAKNAERALRILKPLLLELSGQAPKQTPDSRPTTGPVVA